MPKSFSLKNDIGKKEINTDVTKEEVVKPNIDATDSFTDEALQDAWKEIAEKHKSQPRLYQNLITYLPNKQSDQIIEVRMPSESLTRVLQQLRMELLFDLQTRLNNGKVDLVINTVKNVIEGPKRAYTAEEKYQEMADQNPELQNHDLYTAPVPGDSLHGS